jgi:hypothetical protein
MSNFCSDQGRTRVCGPRIAGQEGVRLYAAAGRPRPPAPLPARRPTGRMVEPTPRRENAEQGKKGHLWMGTSYKSQYGIDRRDILRCSNSHKSIDKRLPNSTAKLLLLLFGRYQKP